MPSPDAIRSPPAATLSSLEAYGYRSTTLATLPHGQALQVASRPGSSGRTVLITAGSHADEIAGVAAAFEIASHDRSGHALHIVPVRDPLGWLGFNRGLMLDLSLSRSPSIATHEQARAFLQRHTSTLFDDGDLIVGRGERLAFASRHYSPFVSSDLARYQLQRELPESAIAELVGRRILLPGSVATGPERSPYDWGGSSAYVGDDGWIGHYNRFFDRPDAPTEVRALREYISAIRPDLTLDLHEGFGDGFYLFVPPEPSAVTLEIAGIMIDTVARSGQRISDLSVMRHLWRPEVTAIMVEHVPGIFSMRGATGPERGTLAAACASFGPCIITEAGMERDVAARTRDIIAAATAALTNLQHLETP